MAGKRCRGPRPASSEQAPIGRDSLPAIGGGKQPTMSDNADSGQMALLCDRLNGSKPEIVDRAEDIADHLNDRLEDTFEVAEVNPREQSVVITFDLMPSTTANYARPANADGMEIDVKFMTNIEGLERVNVVRRSFCDHPAEEVAEEDQSLLDQEVQIAHRCGVCDSVIDTEAKA